MLCQSTELDYQHLEPWSKTDAGIFVLLQLYNLGYLEFNNE